MESNDFQNYGRMVEQGVSPTEMSGRYPSQSEAERTILADVLDKLKPQSSNSLLDIGCGVGQLLIPLSFLVESVTGIDHPTVLRHLEKRTNLQNVELIAGEFSEVSLSGRTFDRILCYSVVQNVRDYTQLVSFLKKVCGVLKPGGSALIGDLSNLSAKLRFQASDFGQKFERQWADGRGSESSIDSRKLLPKSDRVVLDDDSILRILRQVREWGFESYLLPQPRHLPWGFSREDVLIMAR